MIHDSILVAITEASAIRIGMQCLLCKSTASYRCYTFFLEAFFLPHLKLKGILTVLQDEHTRGLYACLDITVRAEECHSWLTRMRTFSACANEMITYNGKYTEDLGKDGD